VRDHNLFREPVHIDVKKTIRVPAPAVFRSEATNEEVEVLPLVRNRSRDWPVGGWTTYYDPDFERLPYLEYLCGGLNVRAPNAAAVWRQGNLLHFAFAQSPAEMNETGQALLLNAIVYISRFADDRPFVTLTSSGPWARTRVGNIITNEHSDLKSLSQWLSPSTYAKVKDKDRATCRAWFNEAGGYLDPLAKKRGVPTSELRGSRRASDGGF
jgi:hypothetical protein